MGLGQQELMGLSPLLMPAGPANMPVCGEGRQALRLLLHAPSRDILKRQRWNGM